MFNGMVTTHQDRLDLEDAKRLGISLHEYKEARATIVYSSSKTISKSELLELCKNMHITNRIQRG